jgi:hypothetical protein
MSKPRHRERKSDIIFGVNVDSESASGGILAVRAGDSGNDGPIWSLPGVQPTTAFNIHSANGSRQRSGRGRDAGRSRGGDCREVHRLLLVPRGPVSSSRGATG